MSRIFHWGQEGPKAEIGGGFLGEEEVTPSNQLLGLVERCELPQLGSVLSPDRSKVFPQDGLSRHCKIIVNCGRGWQDPRATPAYVPDGRAS